MGAMTVSFCSTEIQVQAASPDRSEGGHRQG